MRCFLLVNRPDPEVEPLIVPVRVDVVLQEQVVVMGVVFSEHRVQVPALKIAKELELG